MKNKGNETILERKNGHRRIFREGATEVEG